jgi:hypothetical protein
MNKAEIREQVEAMTEEEAADAVLVYAPDWPDKITPIAEVIARRRGVEVPRQAARSGSGRKGPEQISDNLIS